MASSPIVIGDTLITQTENDADSFATGLDVQTATVVVRPDALVRTYPQGITETLRLFDGQDVVEVEIEAIGTLRNGIRDDA